MDVDEKDLILCTHRFGGGHSQKNVTHFVTRWVVHKVVVVLPKEIKRQTLQNIRECAIIEERASTLS